MSFGGVDRISQVSEQSVGNAYPASPDQAETKTPLEVNISLTEHLLHHVGLLPFVAKQICRNAGENDAGAYQALEGSGPEGHNNHENAAQHKRDRDEEVHLQKRTHKCRIKCHF